MNRVRNTNTAGRTACFIVVTVCLILVIAFSITGTVKSQSREALAAQESYFREQEKQLAKDIREWLYDKGYRNSGVNLTRVVNADGERIYTVSVHHRAINNLSEEERELLGKEIDSLAFYADNCRFCHEFLGSDS